jgi:hypothetical protein
MNNTKVQKKKSKNSFDELVGRVNFILGSDHPRRKYQRRGWDNKKTIRHWGQRKLWLSEVWFLTEWGHLSDTIVYAGAAPGGHTPYLMEMFPNHKIILVDPNPFQIEETDRITIINDYFTDEMAESYADKGVLFISDVRTADFRQMSRLENEQYIIRDNEVQMGWVNSMKPCKSMLKFRCPYPDVIEGTTTMFKGTIFIQPWAPASSTESRLIPDDSLELTEYDNLDYEEKFFHHNTVTRYKTFKQPVKGEGLDKCFDAAAEVVILGQYLRKYDHFSKGSLYKSIADVSKTASAKMTKTGRTLATPMKDPNLKRNFPKIDHTVFYDSNPVDMPDVTVSKGYQDDDSDDDAGPSSKSPAGMSLVDVVKSSMS